MRAALGAHIPGDGCIAPVEAQLHADDAWVPHTGAVRLRGTSLGLVLERAAFSWGSLGGFFLAHAIGALRRGVVFSWWAHGLLGDRRLRRLNHWSLRDRCRRRW